MKDPIIREQKIIFAYDIDDWVKLLNPINIAKGSGDSKLQAAIDQLLVSINESDIYVLRKRLRKADKTISDINNKFN